MFGEPSFRLTKSMVYMNSNISTGNLQKNFFTLSTHTLSRKRSSLPQPDQVQIKAVLSVSALLFLIGCTRTKREKKSTNIMRIFVLEFEEVRVSTCGKSIHHISLMKRSSTGSLGNPRHRFSKLV